MRGQLAGAGEAGPAVKLVCRACGATASAELWAEDAATREALALILGLPGPVRDVCLPYLGLFRPPARALAWTRVCTLVKELRDLVTAREIAWKKNPARPCTPELWAQGMRQMIETKRGQDRFESHGYLKSIVYDLADKADAEREKKYHQDAARGKVKREEPEGGGPMPEEIRAMLEATKRQLGVRR